MDDIFKKLRDQALDRSAELKRESDLRRKASGEKPAEDPVMREVAEYLGQPVNDVAYCCGNICPHCQIFLDKAIALIELGHDHHLFMNPVQEDQFQNALGIFRRDRMEYETSKQELMDAMR
jgi:hypothetical protein